MSILITLQDEMKSAMKARDQVRLDALRLMVSSIKYAQVDSPNISDEQIVAVLQKEAKKRREAIEAYKSAGRNEALAKEQYELKLIEDYLPKSLSEEEVRAKVKEALETAKPDNFGMAMKAAMTAVGGQSDGGTVAKIVKEFFATKS
jgi:uncharacterized protein YqeY